MPTLKPELVEELEQQEYANEILAALLNGLKNHQDGLGRRIKLTRIDDCDVS